MTATISSTYDKMSVTMDTDLAIDFPAWLTSERENREWSQSDLSRHANISRQVISDYENRKRKYYDEAILKKIAHAFKLPPETVFRAAGILPQQTPENETIEQISHLTKELPAQEQSDILEFVKLRHRIAEERKKNETKRSRNKPAIP
jgi:transcriptional regulator with XRE-family HTH domain